MKRAFSILLSSLLLVSCVDMLPRDEETKDTSGTSLTEFSVVVGDKEYYPIDTAGTKWVIPVPEGTTLTNLVARFKDNASSVTVNGVEQESGVSANSFINYKKGVVYRLTSQDGRTTDYTINVIDTRLPVVSITTATPGAIKDKVTWRDASIKIMDADGNVANLGSTGIRGRGNWTWEKYPKKPYALKLGKKQQVLGMPEHKRWVLLALYRGFIGNALMFEATRRAPALEWAPRGEFVELVLNGKFQGLYYLCEHIKIDKNRVNITELKPTDVNYPEVSGGFLLEYDELYDEDYKFKSSGFNLPVQLKAPNDDVPDAQFNYIRDFINSMEAELLKIGSSGGSRYADYLDIDTFAEFWMVLETIGNYEAYKPRSVKMYKGRDGVDSPAGTVCKLKAGPLWDQELFLVDKVFNSKDAHYFKYLFKDPEFVATVKERWPAYKDNILGNDTYIGFVDYLNQMVSQIKTSANRDIALWGNEYFTLSGEVSPVKRGFVSKINWMDTQINAL